jgi:hypothetical protein
LETDLPAFSDLAFPDLPAALPPFPPLEVLLNPLFLPMFHEPHPTGGSVDPIQVNTVGVNDPLHAEGGDVFMAVGVFEASGVVLDVFAVTGGDVAEVGVYVVVASVGAGVVE